MLRRPEAWNSDGTILIDFETLHPGEEKSYIHIPDGYMGMKWSKYFRGQTSKNKPGTGFEAGTSGDMSAYTSGHKKVFMASDDGSLFDFVGADITAAWLDNESVTVEGWRGHEILYIVDIQTHTNGPHWFTLNLEDVDKVWFKPISKSGNHHIVIDNIVINR
ncbi:MAG: hypothetical protein ACYSN9_06145 [Planctomycetota bacterium]